MIQRYHNEPVGLRVTPEPGDYLKLHDRILPDGSEQITVGRGESWSVLACKEVYGKASKAVQASGAKSAVFDLSAAAELGRDGLLAAAEGICGGAYQMKYTLRSVGAGICLLCLRRGLAGAGPAARLDAGGVHPPHAQSCEPPCQSAHAGGGLPPR